ncbi:MAG TPA: hypothetical protein VHE34_26225 [Puia sp.]|uniref:hypothetical protein n=1 Tax=Puia sp. TaxID=2045100 RepID=UPI002B930B0D|nr:hypothetical protein [Puia sp.]HVU98757.1 hypothetical protein [Puia sp.]
MTKQLLLAIAIAGSLMGLTGCAVDGYVETQPADVVYTRPVAPGPDYIWIEGDWIYSGGRYNWHPGYWRRGRPGRAWVGGSWSHTPHGYHWNRGHWRR